MIALLRKVWGWPKPWNWVGMLGIVFVVGVAVTWTITSIQSCGYHQAETKYKAEDVVQKARVDQLLGQIAQRDKDIATLELQKLALVTLTEQGVKLEAGKAKELEVIAAKEVADLENAKLPMDCRGRVKLTIDLLLTAKPPIKLDLAATIREQCGAE